MWNYGQLPNGWAAERIGDYATVITDYVANGSFASLAQNVEYKSQPDYAVLIRLTDFNNNFEGNFVYIDEHAYEFLTKSKLTGGEVIISNVGANVGTVFKCPYLNTPMSLGPNAIMFKTKGNDDFMYYWFRSRNGQHSLKSIVTGSAQPKFNKTNFRDLYVPVPPRKVQNQIARYLGNIDKKIEVNSKINENLLNQVSAVYHEMFPTIGSRTICRADEYFDISIGKTPPRKEPHWFTKNPDDVTWVSISDMGSCGLYISESSEQLTPEAVETFNINIVPDNTVLLSFKLTVGRIAISDGLLTTNEAIAHFKTDKPEINEYLYCYLKAFDFRTLGSTSSIAIAVNSKIIKGMPFVVPTNKELKCFHSFARPLFMEIKSNIRENQRLSALRDALLPKLMSGELDVSTIDL